MAPMRPAPTTTAPAVRASCCEVTGPATSGGRRGGRGLERCEELHHVGAIARPPHGRNEVEDLSAVAGFGQALVEYGHHASIGRRTDEPAGALGQQGGGARQVD